MKLGYTILCVPSVKSSLQFFGQAVGLKQGVLCESDDYGEFKTGETTFAFASHELGVMNFPDGHMRASDSKQLLGMEIALVTEDVHQAHQSALAFGATKLSAPAMKPWGQTVSHVQSPSTESSPRHMGGLGVGAPAPRLSLSGRAPNWPW